MRETPIRTLTSASLLALLMSQLTVTGTAGATEPQTAPPAAPAAAPSAATPPAAATPEAQPPAPSPAEAARARADERRAAMDAEREKRYAELRASAAQMGVELPETPPWKSAQTTMPQPPEPPMMPGHFGRPSPEDREAWQKQREERWKQMQAEAAARGAQMPERPSWEDIEQRRKAMEERFAAYRKTIEEMTDEQREAARAYFGRNHARPYPGMPRADWGSGAWDHPCQGDTPGMAYPPMMPYHSEGPGYDQGPPPPPTSQGTN